MLRPALPPSYHRPKLCSIQTLLLLQYPPDDPLNPITPSNGALPCERIVRKRLSWALFMQDRWTTLAYRRPVHIHHDDWTVKDLTPADFSNCECEGSAVTQAQAQALTIMTAILAV
ncbi:hypothetical protein G7Z17_g4466 [Cylindrodendrum hubeiense]|uniref:Transcription factor domain-containing protein n=1 Tax=Cylindrodendrum hubeiense TaxID=595255 RepID=A0A9P5H8R1_9HYPO|nr:hypothetical protein G7Z17_g4466 [Cylindrodendrum hubeiense]